MDCLEGIIYYTDREKYFRNIISQCLVYEKNHSFRKTFKTLERVNSIALVKTNLKILVQYI